MGGHLLVLKSDLKIWLLLFLGCIIYSTPSSAFDSTQCFLGYAKMGGNNLDNHLKQCLTSIMGESLDGTPNNLIMSLQKDAENKPQAAHLLNISKKAQEVYYDNSICGRSVTITQVTCSRLRQLSQLNTSGMYRYNCAQDSPSHSRCADFSLGIIEKMDGICDKSHVNKNNCNDLISAFLAHPRCKSDATERACLTYFDDRMKVADGCDMANNSFDANGCTGTDIGFGVASVTNNEEDPTVGDDYGGGGGDGNPNDPTNGGEVTSADGEKLSQAANQLGQNMFGGMGMMNQMPSPTNVPKSDPSSKASVGGFDGPQGLNDARMADVPGGSVHLPLANNLPIPTEGRPGPRQQPGGTNAASGSTPNPIMGGGSGGMGGSAGGSGGGGGNPAKGSGGGYRGSAWQKIADALGGNNYMGTDGARGGSKVEPAKSALPKALQKKIAENKEAELARAKVNAMFRKNLPVGASRGQFESPLQFPSVNNAFDSIYREQNYYQDSN